MEIPVSEQMSRLKDKIESFRQMLSNSNICDQSFDENNESDSFLSPESIRYHRLLQKYTQPDVNYPCYSSNSIRRTPFNPNQSDVRTLLQRNGIKNISRGYHYSNQNLPRNAYRPKKKPILFIRPDTSSSFDYSSDDSDDYHRPKTRSNRKRYNISQEISSDSMDDYTYQSQISNDSNYSSESDSINEYETEDEEEELTDEDIDPKPFKYIGYALQNQRQSRDNKQKNPNKHNKKKQSQKKKDNEAPKRPVQKLAEMKLDQSSDDSEDSGDSLVEGLIRNAENIGFISPNSSKINSSDEVILVKKPVLPQRNENLKVDSPIKVGKEFDQLINKLATVQINKNDSSDEEALMEYEEEIPDLQGIIQRAKATQSDLGLHNSSSRMDSNPNESDDDDPIANLPSFKSLLGQNLSFDEDDEDYDNNKKPNNLNENNEFDYKLNLGSSSDDDASGIAQTKKNISEILMGLNLDDSDEHTETDSSLDLNNNDNNKDYQQQTVYDNSNTEKKKVYGPALKEIQEHLEKPIPKVDSNNSEESYNNTSDSFGK